MKKSLREDYLTLLKERKKTSRAYTPHQLAGLAIAEILGDEKHKSLYIKLAKEYGVEKLVALSKDVASRPRVKNKGAYFMRLFTESIRSEKARIKSRIPAKT